MSHTPWKRSDAPLPDNLYCGDRVVVCVHERNPHTEKLEDVLIVVQAEENGWSCGDSTFDGYGPYDGTHWGRESEVIAALNSHEALKAQHAQLREAAERAARELSQAIVDLKQWRQLARRQHEEMPNASHNPLAPTQAGIDQTTTVIRKSTTAMNALSAALREGGNVQPVNHPGPENDFA